MSPAGDALLHPVQQVRGFSDGIKPGSWKDVGQKDGTAEQVNHLAVC